jgi:indole-3-glycerol phosphate synthase
MSVLDEILAHKREELSEARRRVPPEAMAERAAARREAPRGLRRALATARPPAVIAEIKRRSPSRGEIRPDLDPVGIAKAYADGGAAAISVLTDERYFGGSLGVLRAVRDATDLPLLRKDFVIDPYQIDEARVAGADAVLLIVAALDAAALGALLARARDLGLDALVEVHDAAELEVARGVGADLIGINNRNLHTFATDLGVTERLAPMAPPDALLVAESGILCHEDVQRLERAGARAFLVGESLMREADVGLALRRIRGFS